MLTSYAFWLLFANGSDTANASNGLERLVLADFGDSEAVAQGPLSAGQGQQGDGAAQRLAFRGVFIVRKTLEHGALSSRERHFEVHYAIFGLLPRTRAATMAGSAQPNPFGLDVSETSRCA